MLRKNKPSSKLMARLMPLYVAAFFHGFVFWYPIEKIFMKSEIGFSDTGIGIMIAFYSSIMLLAETPSGILADRWSRRGVLILASIALALSSFVGGASVNELMYLVANGFWGIFFALYSGTYESIVYDTILEEGEDSREYERYFGRVSIFEGTGLVAGSLVGGFLANYLGFRYAYFLTVPASLMAVVALLRFKEPKLHKMAVYEPIRQHVANTFRSVLRRGQLVPVLVVLIAGTVLTYLSLEFSQLWVIALAAPLVWFGPINSVILSTIGIGGWVAGRFKLRQKTRAFAVLGLMGLSCLILIFGRKLPLTVAALVSLIGGIVALRIVFSRVLHDALGSNVRAGAASAISTIGRLIIIPSSLVFGYISEQYSIFKAAWILAGLVIVVAIFTAYSFAKQKELPVLKEM